MVRIVARQQFKLMLGSKISRHCLVGFIRGSTEPRGLLVKITCKQCLTIIYGIALCEFYLIICLNYSKY